MLKMNIEWMRRGQGKEKIKSEKMADSGQPQCTGCEITSLRVWPGVEIIQGPLSAKPDVHENFSGNVCVKRLGRAGRSLRRGT